MDNDLILTWKKDSSKRYSEFLKELDMKNTDRINSSHSVLSKFKDIITDIRRTSILLKFSYPYICLDHISELRIKVSDSDIICVHYIHENKSIKLRVLYTKTNSTNEESLYTYDFGDYYQTRDITLALEYFSKLLGCYLGGMPNFQIITKLYPELRPY